MDNKKINVLLVEDEEIVCLVHKSCLESLGCQVEVARNSMDALEKIIQPFDLVLMDIGLPGITGIEVVDIYRQKESREPKLPIVFLTAYQGDEVRKKCLEVGGNDFFTKPISKETFKQIINNYCLGK